MLLFVTVSMFLSWESFQDRLFFFLGNMLHFDYSEREEKRGAVEGMNVYSCCNMVITGI